ncbi:unnamed protein product [Adineta ricciae]|uniref:F-box domain-containing protein n=1 Tax=Adineta ricciae TaxID=249248 RepID=A0A814V9Y4_ADIRI|nr:unnamed protein product [Adineta ricciae]CAF1185193.1 unnamed protein product [Adineta ricciae]
MSRTKRQKIDDDTSTVTTKFEHLPNELIVLCLSYLTFFELYESFFGLNQRLNQLLLSKPTIYIDSIPETQFLTHCFNLSHFLSQSQNGLLALRSYDENQFKLIMKDHLFKDKFSRLKSLTLNSIHADSIYDVIFNEEMKLYDILERLFLSEVSEEEEHGSAVNRLCNRLISSKMKSLNYLNMSFTPYRCGCENNIQSGRDKVDLEFKRKASTSHLETLIIGEIDGEKQTQISFRTLTDKLLPRLLKLKTLMIDSVHFEHEKHSYSQGVMKNKSVLTMNLKTVKVWIKRQDQRHKSVLEDFFIKSSSSDDLAVEIFCGDDENSFE